MIIAKIRLFETTGAIFIAFAFTGMLLFIGCSGDDATGLQTPQVAMIAISPDSVSFEAGEQLEFSVVALTAMGETIDIDELDIEWNWWSTDPEVFTVEPGGLATGQNPGEAFCMVEATIGVGQNIPDLIDKLYVTTDFVQAGQPRVQTVNLELAAGNREIKAFENIALKNRLRFNGRDSAFVVIF
jgi:hypothetical protein